MVYLGQYQDVAIDFDKALKFIKHSYADDLEGYDGYNVNVILEILNKKYNHTVAAGSESGAYNSRRRRSTDTTGHISDITNVIDMQNPDDMTSSLHVHDSASSSAGSMLEQGAVQLQTDGESSVKGDSYSHLSLSHWLCRTFLAHQSQHRTHQDMQSNSMQRVHVDVPHVRSRRGASSSYPSSYSNNTTNSSWYEIEKKYKKKKSLSYTLLKVAHIFHYISIAILGIFVLQVIIFRPFIALC